MTGFEARTIHRLLEFDPKTMFKRDSQNPSLPRRLSLMKRQCWTCFSLPVAESSAVGCTSTASWGYRPAALSRTRSGVARPDQLRTGAGDAADSGVPTSRHVKLSVMLTGLTAASFLNLHAFQTQQSDCLGVSVSEPEDGVEAIRNLVTNLIPAGLTQLLTSYKFCVQLREVLWERVISTQCCKH